MKFKIIATKQPINIHIEDSKLKHILKSLLNEVDHFDAFGRVTEDDWKAHKISEERKQGPKIERQ